MTTKPLIFRRRDFLTSAAGLLAAPVIGHANTIAGQLPWKPNAGDPPTPTIAGPWLFFTSAEGAAMEALADRIIPADPQTPGGKDAGCVVFVDRQLAGPYGRQQGLYLHAPFKDGAKNQGPQTEAGPAQKYRVALAALDRACATRFGGHAFAQLSDADKDSMLKGLEGGEVTLEGADGKAFFEQTIRDIQMGFFADPVYGGNRDMVAWRMIGYPGARYNYLDWVGRHNERFPLPPVGIAGRAEWTPKSG